MARRLSADERRLWEQLARTVRPLRPAASKTANDEVAGLAAGVSDAPVAAAAAEPLRPPTRRSPAPSPLAAMEERTRRRLARGRIAPDARIDLHGMSQAEAYDALRAFLRRSQAAGARIVLVITGKGWAGEGRGVLRASLPHWLARPDMRRLVLGVDEASRRHGGGGAFYVRLRKAGEQRGAGPT